MAVQCLVILHSWGSITRSVAAHEQPQRRRGGGGGGVISNDFIEGRIWGGGGVPGVPPPPPPCPKMYLRLLFDVAFLYLPLYPFSCVSSPILDYKYKKRPQNYRSNAKLSRLLGAMPPRPPSLGGPWTPADFLDPLPPFLTWSGPVILFLARRLREL